MSDDEYFCVGAEDILDDTIDDTDGMTGGAADVVDVIDARIDTADTYEPMFVTQEIQGTHATHATKVAAVSAVSAGNDNVDLIDDEPIVSPPMFGTTKEPTLEFANAAIAKPITSFNRDDIKRLMFQRNFQREKILAALSLVREYIANHKLILTGGMAIDAAMRVTGSQLYPDDELPDYDFFSTEFHRDAYRIANMLVAKDFDNVSVIRAMHTSTMRVRVNYVVVADITYLPQTVLERIPTIVYKNLRYVAAHFQMIDQHLMLGHPYINAPREALFNRWKKDLERNALLAKASPFKKLTPGDIPQCTEVKFDVADVTGHCLGGYAALSIWVELARADGYTGASLDQHARAALDVLANHNFHENYFTCGIPDYARCVFYSDEPLELAKKLSDKPHRYYNCFTDKLPQKLTTGVYEIFDNTGRMMGAHKPYTTRGFYIANLQPLLVYFMTCNIWYDPAYITGVVIARDIFLWAGAEYVDEIKSRHLLKYLPTVLVYGKYNWSESYQLARRELLEARGLMKKNELLTPQNAYPTKTAPVPVDYHKFVPQDSEIYQFDGAPRNTPWVPNHLVGVDATK